MADRPDPSRRKQLLRELKEKQQAESFAELPADRDELKALFDKLDRQLPTKGCDHTLRLTKAHLTEHGLSHESMIPWLHKHGGYCDCEVLANVEPHVLSLFDW